MNRRARRTLTTTSLISAAVAVTMAAGITATWTFLPGGEITAFNVGDAGAVTDRGTVVTCTTSTVKVSAKSGSGLSGQDIGSISEMTLEGNDSDPSDSRCLSTPGGIFIRIMLRDLPWKFSVESYDPASGEVSGKVTGVKAGFQGSDGCSAEFTAPGGGPGEVFVTYSNSEGTVRTDPTRFSLVATTLTGTCDPDLIAIGDGLAAAGIWEVQPKQEVTSP